MAPDQLARFRTRLQTLRARLGATIRDAVDAIGEDSSPPGDRVNPLIDEVELESTIERSEAGLLAKVNAALGRIEQGTFGRCEDCGRTIPAGRLAALPHAARCVVCEQDYEQSRGPACVAGHRA